MITFSSQEIDLASDPVVLLIKNRVMEKAQQLLGEFERYINQQFNGVELPSEINLLHGKISKGEHYKHLPFLMLDYPACFSKDHILALRSMFYWGNFISFTIHLRGKYLNKYAPSLLAQFRGTPDAYFCVNETEWEYVYKPNNYVQLATLTEAEINNHFAAYGFMKISQYIEIDAIHQSKEKLADFMALMLPIFKNN